MKCRAPGCRQHVFGAEYGLGIPFCAIHALLYAFVSGMTGQVTTQPNQSQASHLPVYFRCKVCDGDHPSPIRFTSRKDFESARIVSMGFQCPQEGILEAYNKQDMYVLRPFQPFQPSKQKPIPKPKPIRLPNYYKVLGVPRTASTDIIKAAYRRKALRFHPDRPGGSTEKMQLLNAAYAVLSNTQRKEAYDKLWSQNKVPRPAPAR